MALQRFATLLGDVEVLQSVLAMMARPGGPYLQQAQQRPPRQQTVQLTTDELAQVRNIAQTMNLTEQQVIPIYIQANRNAEVTAGLIYEIMPEVAMQAFANQSQSQPQQAQ